MKLKSAIIRPHSSSFKSRKELLDKRRSRFRILVCVDGSEASYNGVRFASRIAASDDCDIILLCVRPIDQDMRSGGLQARITRENMLDWGIELPGIRYLKEGLSILGGDESLTDHWTTTASHTDSWGDPLGDNKVEYHRDTGKIIVLKLKTAPDIASGILDQYELGPYNLMILGEPSHWHSPTRAFFSASVAQKVMMLSPCSVLLARSRRLNQKKGHLICVDGTRHSLEAMRREAIFAQHCEEDVTVLCIAREAKELSTAERVVEKSVEMLLKIGVKNPKKLIGVGDPAEEIIRHGKEFSIIAVADSGMGVFRRLLKRGIVSKVMGTADTSVLNVR